MRNASGVKAAVMFILAASSVVGHVRESKIPEGAATKAFVSGALVSSDAPKLLDSYGDINFNAETEHLDDLAIKLQENPRATGLIFVCRKAGEPHKIAIYRAERAKDYVVHMRQIDSGRIETKTGRRPREERTYLYILQPNDSIPRIRGCTPD